MGDVPLRAEKIVLAGRDLHLVELLRHDPVLGKPALRNKPCRDCPQLPNFSALDAAGSRVSKTLQGLSPCGWDFLVASRSDATPYSSDLCQPGVTGGSVAPRRNRHGWGRLIHALRCCVAERRNPLSDATPYQNPTGTVPLASGSRQGRTPSCHASGRPRRQRPWRGACGGESRGRRTRRPLGRLRTRLS